jgi:predicted lipoprotein with Yx(FWY)xxD motif
LPAPLLVFAAAMLLPPDTPIDVQIISESGRYVLRTADPAKSLYTHDRDPPGQATCLDRCARAWPPLRVSARAVPVGRWTVVVRPDGQRQWAFDGKPVYTHAADSDGRATGDAVGGVWHLLDTFPVR